jgi:xanthine phosphoribosyltransferase
MKKLEDRIMQDGRIIDNEILKVDSFINHQIDCAMLRDISRHMRNKFENIDKIVTIETSGIAFAVGVAMEYNDIPVVFAKKTGSKIMDNNNAYQSVVKSFTKGTVNNICIDKRFLKKGERVLIVDDFLAEGNAALGLVDILKQADCEVVGIAVCVEKRFQGGRQKLEGLGYKVYAAASIDAFVDGKPIFHRYSK